MTTESFNLAKKPLLQCVIDTADCNEDFAKEIIDQLIAAGEEFTAQAVIECVDYLERDGRA